MAFFRQKEILETIVDHIPVLITFISAEGETEWVNKEWEKVLGWTLKEAKEQDVLAKMYPDPEYQRKVLDFALTPPPEWHDFQTRVKDGRILDMSWANVLLSDGRSIGFGQDVTDRKHVEDQLQRYAARLEILRDLDQAVLATHSVYEITQAALDSLHRLVNHQRASIAVFDFQAEVAHLIRVCTENTSQLEANTEISLHQTIKFDLLYQGHYRLINDIQDLSTPSEIEMRLLAEGVRSYLVIPLLVRGELIGTLNVGASNPSAFDLEQIQIGQEIANVLAVGLHHVRLHEQVQNHTIELEQRVAERTAELAKSNVRLKQALRKRKAAVVTEREQRALAEALRDTADVLNSSLALDDVLERILENVGRVVPHDSASVMLVESGVAQVVRCRGYHDSAAEKILMAERYVLDKTPYLQQMAQTKAPLAIPDVSFDANWMKLPGMTWPFSYAGAPIQREGQIIGFLNLESAALDFFTQTHTENLGIFANQAAIAVYNAQLYSQAQELAALQERQRLARELHDSVNQTLWSANLIAEVLPAQWEQNSTKGRARLQRLRQFTQGALAEMRMLLLELQPVSLLETGINELLEHLGRIAASHTHADVIVTIECEGQLLPEVHIALYRIAQEALNNVVRHAGDPTRIELTLTRRADELELIVSDNGNGFDPNHIAGGHFGLINMRERADAIDGKLEIRSTIGEGTTITMICCQFKDSLGE